MIAGISLLEALHADQVGGHLGSQVSLSLLRDAGVVQDQVHDALDQLVVLTDADHRDPGPFLEQAVRVAGGGAGDLAADIGVMTDVGDPSDQLSVREGRRRDHDVRQMVAAAVIRVVCDKHVTGLHVLAPELFIDVRHHAQHGAEERCQALHLGHAVSVGIDHCRADVPALLHIGGICAADDDPVGFLRHRHQQVPDDFNGYCINASGHFTSPPCP